MPTTHPRYAITDTGATRVMLDTAAKAWPEMAADRRGLLIRLAEERAAELAREQRQAAIAHARTLIDGDVLMGEHAWR